MLRNEPPTTWIKPNHSFNSTHPNSQNFLIKGDNLEALKLLKNAYEKKIKMIYIDPPYNTGNNDFVYKDDRKYTPKELSSLCGMSEEECKKMLEYYSKGKNSHSAWLTFMYPRLSLARNLLKEDGVIFISIDDNEQAQLKLLCDEIFGEENFVAQVAWQNLDTIKNDAKYFSTNHEYILIYAKNIFLTKICGIKKTEKQRAYYKNYDNDFRGDYLLTPIHAKSGNEKAIYKYTFANGQTWTPPKGTYPRYSKERLQEMEMDNRIFLDPNGKKAPQRKTFWSEINDRMPPISFWKYEDFGSTRQSNLELSQLLTKGVFQNPKPVKLIRKILEIISDKDDIILDFFAGSGTTAQAVMELNAEDNGNRRFILVQLPEGIDEKKSKTAYDFVKNTLGIDEPKISDITQERIIRASKQIQEKYPEYQGDLGFQVFELEEIPSELAEIRQSNFEKVNHLLRDEEIEDLLDTQAILQSFCLYDGVPLGEKIEEVDLGGYGAYRYGNRLYLLHQGFETKHLQELLRRNDEDREFCVNQIVLLAYCFESARFREIAEAIKYTSKKSSELALVVRG